MKEITIKTTRKELFSSKIMVILLIGFCVYLFINQLVSAFKSQEIGLTEETITITEVTPGDNYSTLKADGYENPYYCYDTTLTDKVAVSDSLNVKVYITEQYKLIYVVKTDSETLYDTEADFFESLKQSIIVSFIGICATFGYLTYIVISILKKPLEQKYDAVEYQLVQNPIMTNKMMPKTAPIRKKILLFNIFCSIIVGSFVLVALFYKYLVSLLSDSMGIFLGIYAGVVLIGAGLLVFFRPQLDKKDLSLFSNNYKDYIVNGGGESFNLAYKIDAEGIHYSGNGKERSVSFEDANLYTCALFSKGFYAVNLFVATDIANLEEDDVDFVFPLTHEIYQSLKDHNVNVEYLEDVLDKLDEKVKEYSPSSKKTGTVIKFKNNHGFIDVEPENVE